MYRLWTPPAIAWGYGGRGRTLSCAGWLYVYLNALIKLDQEQTSGVFSWLVGGTSSLWVVPPFGLVVLSAIRKQAEQAVWNQLVSKQHPSMTSAGVSSHSHLNWSKKVGWFIKSNISHGCNLGVWKLNLDCSRLSSGQSFGSSITSDYEKKIIMWIFLPRLLLSLSCLSMFVVPLWYTMCKRLNGGEWGRSVM